MTIGSGGHKMSCTQAERVASENVELRVSIERLKMRIHAAIFALDEENIFAARIELHKSLEEETKP